MSHLIGILNKGGVHMTSGLNIIIETLLGGHYKRENGLKNRGRGIWERDMRDQGGTTKEREKVLAQYCLGLLKKHTNEGKEHREG